MSVVGALGVFGGGFEEVERRPVFNSGKSLLGSQRFGRALVRSSNVR